MNAQDLYADFQNNFFGLGRVIDKYSTIGYDLLGRIQQKMANFDNISEDERIRIMITDPDFQEFQQNINKLGAAYAQFIEFVNEEMKTSMPVSLTGEKNQEGSSASGPTSSK
jgi:c-di-GMP-related signal transduction protein